MFLVATPAVPAHAQDITLLNLVNQDRSAAGLQPLQWSDCLASIAQQNAARLAAQGSLSHTDGWNLDLGCGVGSMQAGENIAWIGAGINDSQVNTMYMSDAPHRANVLGPYTYFGTAWVVAPNGYGYNAEEFLSAPSLVPWPPATQTTFYFAEGYTGAGFSESLFLLMPNQSGTAVVDYSTAAGQMGSIPLTLTAGHVSVEDVGLDVGPNQEVSVKVGLPGPGIVERTMHFNTGSWHGSTDQVGVSQPATEWDFAEGSTLPAFSEYLTLQNPGTVPVTATLNYMTDTGTHPTKSLTLPATSRTTVPVFIGDLGDIPACNPGTSCGVGRGIGGVSVRVAATAPIIAERPFYVNSYDFGSGVIQDGHDAFGANGPALTWNFAEGTTLPGFNEYLTLQNPGFSPANVSLNYMDDRGNVTTRMVNVPSQARSTVEVFNSTLGVGRGIGGVSVRVSSDQPVVAERPLYMVHDFGTGPVAGAHVVVGSTSLGTLFGFAAGSTLNGENDYLTIQNPGGSPAHINATYYTPAGVASRSFTVNPNTRHTVEVFNSAEGAGPGFSSVGVVVSSDQPVLVEKPTYGSNSSTYGATDTAGFAPAVSF